MLKFFRQARRLIRRPDEILVILRDGLRKAYARRLFLWKVFEDFLVLFRLVKAWVTGEYRDEPKRTVLWALAAIVYFLSPLDAIPDIFPGGYIDDIAFISFVVKRIRPQLDAFLEWERRKK